MGLSGLELSRAAKEVAMRLDPDSRGLDHATILRGLTRAGIQIRGPNRGQTLLNTLWRQVDFERPGRGWWHWRQRQSDGAPPISSQVGREPRG